MKNQYCNLCDSQNRKVDIIQSFEDSYLTLINPEYNLKTRYIYLCEACGHRYRDPVLDSDDLEVLYAKFRDTSFRSESPDEYFDRIDSLPISESENSEKINWIRANIRGGLNKVKTMLDIGCGGGVFLKKLMDEFKTCEYFGIEPTPSFAQLARNRLGITVWQGEYKSNIFSKKFDMISANQVLEHILDPVEFMANIHADLNEDGFAYIEVPDISDLKELEPTHDRFLMQHVSIFSEESMMYLMRSSRFNVKKIEVVKTIRKRNNLVCLASKA